MTPLAIALIWRHAATTEARKSRALHRLLLDREDALARLRYENAWLEETVAGLRARLEEST